MKRKTTAGLVLTGLALTASLSVNFLHGRERSRELYTHEKTSQSERIVYRINRWFRDPLYDITELVPVHRAVPPLSQDIQNLVPGIEEDLEEAIKAMAGGIPLKVNEQRFEPIYLYPELFDKKDPSYKVLFSTKK